MPSKQRPNYRSYKDLAEALKRKGKRESLPCWICGHAIDYELHWKHPMSYTYDHEDAYANGGAIRGRGRPAHRSCNSRRGAGREVKRVEATNVGYDFTQGPNLDAT